MKWEVSEEAFLFTGAQKQCIRPWDLIQRHMTAASEAETDFVSELRGERERERKRDNPAVN